MYKQIADWFCDKLLFWYVLITGLITSLALLTSFHLLLIDKDRGDLIKESIGRCAAQEQVILHKDEQLESAKIIIQKLMEERQLFGRGFKQDKET